MAKEKVTKEVKVSRLRTAKFLTLTGLPANEMPFKVVRDDAGGEKKHIIRHRTVRRMAPTLVMQFPATATEEQIAGLMKEFGVDEYKVEKTEEGFTVMRNDGQMPATFATIHLKDGVKALVATGQVIASDEDPFPHIAVVGVRFDKSKFADEKSMVEWMTRSGIDISGHQIDNTADAETAIVSLQEKEKGTRDKEVKYCEVDEGVSVVVARSARQDVPASVVEVVSETMYGSWGWGQLDFAAMLADIQYSQVAREAIDALHRVLESIMYYSPLPLSVRKELVNRATSQFAAFMGALMDALPAQVLVTYSDNKETADMTTKQTDQQKAEAKQRADEAKAYATTNKIDVTGKTDDEVLALVEAHKQAAQPVTRGEFATMFKDALTASAPAIGQIVAEAVKGAATQVRTDANDTQTGAAGADKGNQQQNQNSGANLGKEIGEAIRGAVQPLADTVKTVNDNVGALAKRLEAVEGATAVRTDSSDSKETEAEKRQRKDPFKGVFGRKAAAAATS